MVNPSLISSFLTLARHFRVTGLKVYNAQQRHHEDKGHCKARDDGAQRGGVRHPGLPAN